MTTASHADSPDGVENEFVCTIDGVVWEFGQKAIVDGSDGDDPAVGYLTGLNEADKVLHVTRRDDGEGDWFPASSVRHYVEDTSQVEDLEPRDEWEHEWTERVRRQSSACRSLQYQHEARKAETKRVKDALDQALAELRRICSETYTGCSYSVSPPNSRRTIKSSAAYRRPPGIC